MFLKAIAAGRNPAAINNDGGAKPYSDRHYSTVFGRFYYGEAFSGGESC